MSTPIWDFFIAHARQDLPAAEQLFEFLNPRARVFLDSRCIRLGDDWDRTLALAQRGSRVTLVLVSDHVDTAYYEREEIAAAIALGREDPDSHRVVPIFLSAKAERLQTVPYGLRLKHGIQLQGPSELSAAASQLLAMLSDESSPTSHQTSSFVTAAGSTVTRRRLRILGWCLAGIVLSAGTLWLAPWKADHQQPADRSRDLASRAPELCRGNDGAIAMRAFALTVADQQSLPGFIRSNAAVFANEGRGFGCLNALMAWSEEAASSLPVNSSSPSNLALTAALVRDVGPGVSAAIKRISDGEIDAALDGNVVSSAQLADGVQSLLNKWKQENETQSTLLKALQDMSMTPIRNIR